MAAGLGHQPTQTQVPVPPGDQGHCWKRAAAAESAAAPAAIVADKLPAAGPNVTDTQWCDEMCDLTIRVLHKFVVIARGSFQSCWFQRSKR